MNVEDNCPHVSTFLHTQVGVMLHIDTIGKESQLTLAKLIVIEMSAVMIMIYYPLHSIKSTPMSFK